MADTSPPPVPGTAPDADVTKRDFLKLVAGAGAAIGVGAIAWPLIDSMNPSADVLALSSVEVDLTPIAEGMGITVIWQRQADLRAPPHARPRSRRPRT